MCATTSTHVVWPVCVENTDSGRWRRPAYVKGTDDGFQPSQPSLRDWMPEQSILHGEPDAPAFGVKFDV